jgi:hypothetical protein
MCYNCDRATTRNKDYNTLTVLLSPLTDVIKRKTLPDVLKPFADGDCVPAVEQLMQVALVVQRKEQQNSK